MSSATMCVEGSNVRAGWRDGPRLLRVLRLVAVLAVALRAPGVLALCFPYGTPTLAFTNYSPLGTADAFATATVNYICFGGGTSTVGIETPRTMVAGANTLQFEVYQDAGHSVVWPSAPPVGIDERLFGSITIYGRLWPQNAAAGNYATSLTVSFYNSAAQTYPIELPVSLSLVPTCVINPGTLNFGNYDPLSGAPRDAQGSITIQCTRNTSYTVGLGQGNNPAGATRQMASGASRLQYGLYSDAGRAADWTATSTLAGVAPSVSSIPLVVYGRIPAGQMVAPGAYGDVVQSTINF